MEVGQESKPIYCIRCGTPNQSSAQFCSQCAASLQIPSAAPAGYRPAAPPLQQQRRGLPRNTVIVVGAIAVVVVAALSFLLTSKGSSTSTATTPEARIIGKWEQDRGAVDAIEFFTDGTVTFRSRDINLVGNYTFIAADKLRIDWNHRGAGTEILAIQLTQDTLTTRNQTTGKEMDYARVIPPEQGDELTVEALIGDWRPQIAQEGDYYRFSEDGTFVYHFQEQGNNPPAWVQRYRVEADNIVIFECDQDCLKQVPSGAIIPYGPYKATLIGRKLKLEYQGPPMDRLKIIIKDRLVLSAKK